jgi:hypothetical protein
MAVDKIGRDFGKLSGNDHYRVKYPVNGSYTYGIASMYGDSKQFNKYAAQGKLVVEHAIYPQSAAVVESELIDIPLGRNYPRMDELGYFFGKDEYDDYVALQQILHDIIDDRCGEGVVVGRGFSVGVGDGSAHYVVTKVARVNCTVEWRGFCADRWVDRMFGYGGSFRKSDVAIYCRGSLFGKDQSALRLASLPKYVEGFNNNYGFIPSDIEAQLKDIQ